jgi:hypothetical protein
LGLSKALFGRIQKKYRSKDQGKNSEPAHVVIGTLRLE